MSTPKEGWWCFAWRRYQFGCYEPGRLLGTVETSKEALRIKALTTGSPFWTAFMLSSEVILIHRPDGTILEANPTAQEKLGYSVEELVGMNVLDLVQVSEAQMAERVEKKGEQGEISFLANHRRKDGTTFESEVRTRGIELDGEELIVGIGKDLTDQRLAEMLDAALDRTSANISSRMDLDEIVRTSISTAKAALGADSALIALKERDTWVVHYEEGFTPYVRKGAFTSDQSKAASTVERTGKVLVVNDVRNDSRMDQDFAARFGVRSLLMIPLKRNNATIGLLGFFCHDRAGAFSDAHVDFANKLAYSLSLLMENARLSESKKTSEEFLRGVVETVPDAIMVLDKDGRITFVNKEAEKLIGLPRGAILGKSYDDPFWNLRTMSDERVSRENTPFGIVLQSKRPAHNLEYKGMHGESGEVILSTNMTPLLGANGEFNGAIASMTDVTDRKRWENAVKRRTHQLEVLNKVSAGLNSRLQTDTIMRSLVWAAMELTEGTAGTSGVYIDGNMKFTEYNLQGKLSPVDFSFPKGYGVPGWIISTKKAYMTNDAVHDVHVVPAIREALGFTNLVDVPILNARGELLGCFEIHNKADGKDFTPDDVAILEGLASSVAVALENARIMEEKAKYEADLQKQKQDYQTVFESVPAMIAIKDTQGRVTIANHTFMETFGLSADNVSRWTISNNPQVRELHRQDDLEVIAKKTPKVGILERARAGSGELIWLRTDKMPYLDGHGHVTGVIMFSLDITEQRRAQEQLVQEKENMSTLMDTTPSGIVLIDRSGRIAFANRSAEGIMGGDRNALRGRPYDSPERPITDYDGRLLSPEDLPLAKVKASGRSVFGIRHAIQLPSGRRALLLINASPVYNDSGDLNGVIVSMEDVTSSVLTERALRVSMKTSDDIIQQIPSGILLFQYRKPDRLVLLSVNPTANILLGGVEGKLGLDFDQIWRQGAFFATKEEFLEVVKTGQTIWREGVHYSALAVDGNFTFRAFSLPDDRLCVNFDDVTERMREAELRRQAFAQIEKNIEHFATLVDRIRNPLSAIVAQVEAGGGEDAQRVLRRASEIEGILSLLDQGWLESENVRDFLKKSL